MSIDLYMFAGVNGAGKSTLYSSIDANERPKIKNSRRANADEIARDNHWDWRDPVSNFRAMRREVKRINSFIANKQSFNMETTLASSKKTYINILSSAKEQGFTTHLLYVGVDSAELAKERVKYRVAKGGHGIPDEVIDRRYLKSVKNLELLAPFFDSVELYDNTNVFQTIYERNRLKTTTFKTSIVWAQPSIMADKHAIRVKQLALQRLKRAKRKE